MEKDSTLNDTLAEEKNVPTYRIFEYCKTRESVAVACASAFVVILSFFVNMAICVSDWFFLHYWNIESVYISISAPSQMYRIIGNVVYAIAVIIAFSLISSAYEKSIPTIKLSHFLSDKRKHRQRSAILTKIKRIVKREKGALKKNPANHDKIKDKKMRELAEFCTQKAIEFDKIQEILIKRRKEKTTIMRSAGIFSAVASIAFVLLEADLMGNFLQMIITVGILTGFMMAILYAICCFVYKKRDARPKTKDKIDEAICECLNALQDTNHRHCSKRNWREFFNDSNIVATIISTILYMLLFTFIPGLMSNYATAEMHSFPIVYVEEQPYAVIYNTGENVILEECEFFDQGRNPINLEKADLSNAIIDINTNKQRIVKIEGLSFQIVEFRKENVSRNGDIFAQMLMNESEVITTIPIE